MTVYKYNVIVKKDRFPNSRRIMRFRVDIHPSGLQDKENVFTLGEIEANNREEVVATLEAPLETQPGQNREPLVLYDYDYRIVSL